MYLLSFPSSYGCKFNKYTLYSTIQIINENTEKHWVTTKPCRTPSNKSSHFDSELLKYSSCFSTQTIVVACWPYFPACLKASLVKALWKAKCNSFFCPQGHSRSKRLHLFDKSVLMTILLVLSAVKNAAPIYLFQYFPRTETLMTAHPFSLYNQHFSLPPV